MAILNNSNAISTTGGYDINNSIRFRKSASGYLNRTLTTPTNGKIWTLSLWLKRGSLSSVQAIMTAQSGGSEDSFAFLSTDTIRIYFSAYSAGGLVTNAVFRDPSAWYHIVLGVDTTQATASNRVKLYVNGTQQTFTGTDYPSQNATPYFNTALAHYLAYYANNAPYNFDGYNAETHFIDGQALTPSSFGETDTTTGSWKPKAYTGTYGTNGFYLKFSDIATTSGSNAGLGKDFSGNTNYWTTNNISVTAGTTYDAMIDSPTLTSATVANYCVNNPVDTSPAGGVNAITISGANLNLAGASTDWAACRATIGVTSGKWYWECTRTGASNLIFGIGLNSTTLVNAYSSTSYGYFSTGDKYSNNVSSAYGASFTSGDVIGVAFDADAGTLTFYKNNTSQGTAYTGLTSGPYFPLNQVYTTGSTASINFGQRPFTYTPPTGFVALNTYNLPTPTILQGNKYMDATLYTGTSSAQSITNAAGFKPDLIWGKARSTTRFNVLVDSVRGSSKDLYSNATNAEYTDANVISSINSNGFSLGTDAELNLSANTFVAWQWQAGQGSTSSNTSGSITSTVSVNSTAGFSIITFNSGTAGNKTVGHGLGVKPAMFILKNRVSGAAGSNWQVWHQSFSNQAQNYLSLNTTSAVGTDSQFWANAAPTSTVLSFESAYTFLASNDIVGYCWAEIAGFSKAFSYTGNGSADGPFVFCNFSPKFVIIKRTNSTGSWFMVDTSRNTYNLTDLSLYANLSDAEGASTSHCIDILSNGFKCKGVGTNINASGGTYIGMAFASNPFKNSNAR